MRTGCITIFTIITLAFISKAFFFEAYRIPTGSMENTLLPGDYIIVNKSAYGLSTPAYFPLSSIPIPHTSITSYSTPELNDVIVFDFPGQVNEFRSEKQMYFIKRVAGLPGDKVEIISQKVYVNKKLLPYPDSVILSAEPMPYGFKDKRIYPLSENWNNDYYGPLYIPKKGDVIKLTTSNIKDWGNLINREFDKKVVSVEGSVITIQGKPVREYTLQKNYYFVLGDNRSESMDSRYFGFVPEDNIIGKANAIYWSVDPKNSMLQEIFQSIRWERIFTNIK